MSGAGKPVVAVDIPSGLDGDSGRVQGAAVRAAVTVTFGLPKRGCLMAEGPAHTGELIVDPITIPRSLLIP
jgi:NAD(P)H-hydrate epimerase